MAEPEYREYRSEDATSFLALHDSVFPPVTGEFWRAWSAGPTTAAVALVDGAVVGTVPFHFRDLCVRPGVTVRVAWEYSVCVRQGLRSSGIGSALMAEAKAFLRGRAAAMMVYRGGERSPGYRYYARNGHYDLAYLRPWMLDQAPALPYAPVECTGLQEFLAREAEVLAIFAEAYGALGGYPLRHPGYYAAALNTNQYAEVPMQFMAFWQRAEGDPGAPLVAYALVGEEQYTPALQLLEIAARGNDPAAALPLLLAFAHQAAQRGLPAIAYLPDFSPYAPILRAIGFRQTPRSHDSLMIMGHVHDPEALAQAVWRENKATAHLEVWGWTPERHVLLHRPQGLQRRSILLETKEEALTRLLFGRLDLEAAIDQEIVTAVGADEAAVRAIAHALPFTPWAHHHLDYI